MKNNKMVLQYGNLGGIPYRYARALEIVGIKSVNYIPLKKEKDFTEMKRNLPYDNYVCKEEDKKNVQRLKKLIFFLKNAISDYALIHYYSCSILPYSLDYKIFKVLNKPMIVSFGGTDVRIESIAKKNNPYFYQMPYSAGEEKIRKNLIRISKYIKYAAAADYELREYIEPYFEKIFILPQPINTDIYKSNPPLRSNKKPVLFHIPTYKEYKGTKYIVSATERLKNEGFKFEFRLFEPRSTQEEVRKEMSKCDIIIDQIRGGAHGITCVEAMSLGKPVIEYIREDLIYKYPSDLPIVNANPDTIYDKLKMLIKDAELRHEIGIKSRKYVEKYHSLGVIGPRLLEIYREIGLKL